MVQRRRIRKIQKQLGNLGVDALFITNPVDLFYITGLMVSAGALLITQIDIWLLVDSRYMESASGCLSSSHVVQKKSMSLYELLVLQSGKGLKKIGFDSTQESVLALAQYKKELKQYVQEQNETTTLLPLIQPLATIRAIKEDTEIKRIKAACSLCVEGFNYIQEYICEGVTEKELARRLEIYWLTRCADRVAFDSIIAFSSNSSMPHYRPQNRCLRKGDIILVDIGVTLNGYCSDMTRMISFGLENEKLYEIHSIVKEAQDLAFKKAAIGVALRDLDAIARDYIEKHGYGAHFIHSLGHGLGLDVHEWPIIKSTAARSEVLQEGMCITIEPGIYLPKIGGVRIEDTVLITKSGPERLTNCPRDLVELF